MKKSLLILAFAGTMAVAQSAFALTVYDPTNHTENLATKLEAIKQTAHQAEMVQNELKQLAKLNPAYQDETLMQIRSSISSINDIRNSIDAIGTDFNSMMQAFDEISPDYEDWNGVSAEQYARQMDKVREAWDKAVNQSMLSGTVASPDEQQKTADTVTQLVEAAQNAEGTTGAIQALAQLNAIQINELQKMLAITSDAQRTQNMYFKRQIEAEEAGRRRTEIMMDNYEANLKADVSITGDGSDIHHFTR